MQRFVLGLLGGALLCAHCRPAHGGWQTDIAGSSNFAIAVAADANGDAVAAGSLTANADSNMDLAVVKLAGAGGAELWRFVVNTVPGGGISSAISSAYDVAVDSAGNVVAAGGLNQYSNMASIPAKFFAVKIAAASGGEIWRYEIPAMLPLTINRASAVALFANDDAVVAGESQNDPVDRYATYFTVVRLAAANGAEMWRRDLWGNDPERGNVAGALTLSGGGDVVAAGYITNTATGRDFTVVRLAGSDGSQVWRYTTAGTGVDPDPNDHNDLDSDAASAVVCDAAGDVVAVGSVDNDPSSNDLIAVKLSAADGSVLWRTELSGSAPGGTDGASDVIVDAAGNIVVAGALDNAGTGRDLAVVKLAGGTGTVLWQTTIDGTASGSDAAGEVSLDGAGNLVVRGNMENVGTLLDVVVVALAGTDGAELWRQTIDGVNAAYDDGNDLALDGAGDIFVAASTNVPERFTVFKLEGDGTPNPTRTPTVTPTVTPAATPTTTPQFVPKLVRGRKLLVKDRDGDPTRRKLAVDARDDAVIVPAPMGSTADPTNPLTGGAELLVMNPTSNQAMIIELPASKWSVRGNPAGSAGYEYRDTALAAGPCKRVSILYGKLKARCSGAGLSFSLGDSPQGSLAVRLRSGGPSAPIDYCMQFGPSEVIKDSAAQNGRSGVFKAGSAGPPAACP